MFRQQYPIYETQLQSVKEAISTLNIGWLYAVLEDDYFFDEKPKTEFLKSLQGLFNQATAYGDSELIFEQESYCMGLAQCKLRKGKSVYIAVGNHSKKRIPFVFETHNNKVVDIYTCLYYKNRNYEEGNDVYYPWYLRQD